MNNARMILGASCVVSGTGFLVHKDIVKRNGGWNCFLLTEDIQFSTENIIRGDKIGYCADAMFYDEQPVRFVDSWNQRLRWSKGFYQVFFRYWKDLVKKIFVEFKFSCYDMFMTLLPGLLVTVMIIRGLFRRCSRGGYKLKDSDGFIDFAGCLFCDRILYFVFCHGIDHDDNGMEENLL